MPITHEDITELKKVFDDRYVLQSDCNDKQETVNKKFANDDKRIDKLIDRMEIWNKLFWVIASSSIGALVMSVLELILK
jgi:hypothetical protein